jgi:hypothetical protein
MAAPIPRIAAPCRLLAHLLRWAHVAMLRSRYAQQAELAAQISHQVDELAGELIAVQHRLRTAGQQLRALGEIPPHLPDFIEQGHPRCEP